jgi:thiamine-monophosphate kinase
MNEPRLQDIGEQGLLQKLQRYCPAEVVGDDAALLQVAANHLLVVTTDTLVDGVHFSDRTTSPADAGWRAVAANLSDLAAMGAEPLGITVGLTLPGEMPIAWVEQLYQGMTGCLRPWHTPIVGGDICRSAVVSVAISAFGQVQPDRVVRRFTAQPGDAIVITGYHGASRAGLELLLNPELGQNLSEADRAYLIQAHQRPNPRLDVISRLHSLTPANACPRISGMDSSDGLADAVVQICHASRVGAVLERRQIPTPPGFQNLVSDMQAIDWILYGGEDFELVLCLSPLLAQTLVSELGEGAAIVGTITADPIVILRDSTGHYPDETLTLQKGFQHF